MKIKIGIEADGAIGWRGPGRNIRNLVNHMIKLAPEYEFYIYSFNDLRNNIYSDKNVKFIKLPNIPLIPKSNLILPIAVINNKIDCMLFPSGNYWLWPAKKTIIILRTGGPDKQTLNKIDKTHSFVKYKVMPYLADTIVTVSSTNAEKIKKHLGNYKKEILIVNNGIDPLFNSYNIREPKADKDKCLLYVGGFEKGKNIENMLVAFKSICDNDKTIKLNLVGDVRSGRKDVVNVHDIIFRNDLCGNVFVLGKLYEKELVDIYNKAHIFIFPSLLESFGNAPLEAMACGCPVVASNAPAIPEVCGDAAVYFDPYDPQDMAEKIEMVLKDENLRKDLIAKGYQRIKKYSWDESAKKLLKIIEEVANS